MIEAAFETQPAWARKESVDDELLLLGNILHNPKELSNALEIVGAEDFFRPENSAIFRAFDALREDSVSDVTVLELRTKMVDMGQWPSDPDKESELVDMFHALEASAFTSANTRYYAARVKKMAVLRRRSLTLGVLHRRCHNGEIGEDELREEITKMSDESTDSSIVFHTLKESTHDYIDTLSAKADYYFASGIEPLDASVDGVAAGEMCVVAARPGHGKSLIAVQWLDHLSKLGTPSLLISREMRRTAIGARLLQSYTMLDPSAWSSETEGILRGEVNQYHANRATVYIAPDKCGQIGRVERAIRSAKVRFGIKVVAVDYMQLLRSEGKHNRYEEVSDISTRLKNAAMDNDVAMIALCQMNREVESRTNVGFLPSLSDLRESGQIEQDADTALFPQWMCKFDDAQERWKYRIYCLKRRNGKVREQRILLRFNEDRLRIEA